MQQMEIKMTDKARLQNLLRVPTCENCSHDLCEYSPTPDSKEKMIEAQQKQIDKCVRVGI